MIVAGDGPTCAFGHPLAIDPAPIVGHFQREMGGGVAQTGDSKVALRRLAKPPALLGGLDGR